MRKTKLFFSLLLGLCCLLFVACDKDEPRNQKETELNSSVWTGYIQKRSPRGENIEEYLVNAFFKREDATSGKLDISLNDSEGKQVYKYLDLHYTYKESVFKIETIQILIPSFLKQSWFATKHTSNEFVLEIDGGTRKMILQRKN